MNRSLKYNKVATSFIILIIFGKVIVFFISMSTKAKLENDSIGRDLKVEGFFEFSRTNHYIKVSSIQYLIARSRLKAFSVWFALKPLLGTKGVFWYWSTVICKGISVVGFADHN